jgi:hypothetical protein
LTRKVRAEAIVGADEARPVLGEGWLERDRITTANEIHRMGFLLS